MHRRNEVLSGLLGTHNIEDLFRLLKTKVNQGTLISVVTYNKNAATVSAVAVVLRSIFNYYMFLNIPKVTLGQEMVPLIF